MFKKIFILLFILTFFTLLLYSGESINQNILNTGEYNGIFYKYLGDKDKIGKINFKYDSDTSSFDFEISTSKSYVLKVIDIEYEGLAYKDLKVPIVSEIFHGNIYKTIENSYIFVSDLNEKGLIATLKIQVANSKNKKYKQIIGANIDIRTKEYFDEAKKVDDKQNEPNLFFTLYIDAERSILNGYAVIEVLNK